MAGKTSTPKGTRDTLAKVREHVSDVERRLKSADASTKRSVDALETAYNALAQKISGNDIGDLKTHVGELSAHLNQRFEDSRNEIKTELAKALSNPDIDHVREALSRATSRLSAAELRQAESIQKVNEQIIRLATAIDNRVRNETRAREALEHRVNAQLGSAIEETQMRLSAVEDNSAAALRKIGGQVSQLSAELTEARTAIEHRTEGRIYEAALDNQHEIESLKADFSARLDSVSTPAPAAQVDITPVQRSVAALAARMDALESRIGAASLSALSANPADTITPADDQSAPPFQPAQSVPQVPPQTPPLPLPIAQKLTPEPPAPPATAPQDGQPLEFDPTAYANTGYETTPQYPEFEPLALTAPDIAPPLTPPLQEPGAPPTISGLAEAHMALHDYDAPNYETPAGAASDYDMPSYDTPADQTQTYDAPADFDPYGAPQAPDYSGLQAPAYADNPYTVNPYASGLAGAGPNDAQSHQGENPYAPPAYQQDALDLGADMSMAAARPGAHSKPARKKKIRKPANVNAPKFTSRTLRTAASAAALVAVVSAGAWMVKDRLPGAAPKVAAFPGAQNPDKAAVLQVGNTAPQPVQITPATGKMSGLDAPGAIDPSKPRIDNFASLDAAVAAGNPVAQLQKGLTLLQGGSESEAAPYMRAAANQGLPAAQYYLGNMYENGQGVTQDAPQARMLTERAARAGHRIAMYDLALYYIEGKGGVSADMSIAADWFRKAAEFGMTDAQYNLAVLYERGTGVSADPSEAYSWYAIAGSQGDQDAARRAQQLELELPKPTLERAQTKVASFTPAQFDPETNGIFDNLPWNSRAARNGDVATVQTLLLDLGYDVGVADGAMGPRTREALKAFERANGLPETGKVDNTIIQTLKDVAGA